MCSCVRSRSKTSFFTIWNYSTSGQNQNRSCGDQVWIPDWKKGRINTRKSTGRPLFLSTVNLEFAPVLRYVCIIVVFYDLSLVTLAKSNFRRLSKVLTMFLSYVIKKRKMKIITKKFRSRGISIHRLCDDQVWSVCWGKRHKITWRRSGRTLFPSTVNSIFQSASVLRYGYIVLSIYDFTLVSYIRIRDAIPGAQWVGPKAQNWYFHCFPFVIRERLQCKGHQCN